MSGFEVGIIGGGVHGASVAFHLAGRGCRVVLLERGALAGGPTGRSSGVCRAYYTKPFLAEVARDSMAMFANFADATGGGDAGYRRIGGVFLHAAADSDAVTDIVAMLNDLGITVDLLSAAGLEAALPGFDLDGVGVGAWERDLGYADPAGTTAGLARKASADGAVIRTGADVVTITEGPGSVRVTLRGGESVEVERLLIAAGPWTSRLAEQVGATLALTAERHVVASYQWAGVTPVPHYFADLPGGYYFKPEGEHQFQLGSLHDSPACNPDDYPEELTADESVELAAAMVCRAPRLAEAVGDGGWASLYDMSPDGQPVIGAVSERVYVDAGTSGHGFKLAPALGGYIADLLTGAAVHPGMLAFAPDRFARREFIDIAWKEFKPLG